MSGGGASAACGRDPPLVLAGPPSDARALANRIEVRDSADGLAGFHLLAHGTSAETALRLALERAASVRTLVLVAAAPPSDPELSARLARLNIPTLVILGTRDRETPPSIGGRWRRVLPGCQLAFLYDAGADPAADRPAAFADLVTDFIRDPGAFLVNRRDGSVRYE